MDRHGRCNGADIEQEQSRLLRGEGAGGFAGMNPLYIRWGRKNVTACSLWGLALVAIAAWWFG